MKLILTLIFLCIAFLSQVFSATITSTTTTGNWTQTASWVGGTLPTANDTVVIVNGSNITINTAAIIYKLTINTGGILNLSDQTLTLQGSGTAFGTINIYGTLNGNTGMLNVTGNFYNSGTFNANTSTVTFIGTSGQGIGGTAISEFHHLRTTNVSSGPGMGVSMHPVNTIIKGNFIADGSWNRNSDGNPNASVTFDGTTQLSGAYSFYMNNIIVNAGATVMAGNKNIYLYGNFTCNGSFVCQTSHLYIQIDTYNTTVQPNNQKIAVTDYSNNKFYNVTVNKGSGKVSPINHGTNTYGNLMVANNFTVNTGTWDVDGERRLYVGGNFTVNAGSTFIPNIGRVLMNGSSTFQQMINASNLALYKLTIDNTGAGVKLATSISVTYDLTLSQGILYTRNGSINNEIFVNNTATTAIPAGYSANSFVAGNLRRAISANIYDFPVGTSNSVSPKYRPIQLNITNANSATTVLVCQDSSVNSGTYYANWWTKILPNSGNPIGTITFPYALANDFAAGINECAISVMRGTPSPTPNWNFILTTSSPASLGNITITAPIDYSPYGYILGEPMPVASNQTICDGGSANLSIASPTGYGTFNWYNQETLGTNLQSSSTTYATGVLNDTTTYWISYVNPQCESHRWPVTVNSNPIPTSSFTTTDPVCYNSISEIEFIGTASAGGTFTWNFGGGSISSGSGEGPYEISYASHGTYNVSLTVSEYGCTSTQTIESVEVPQIISLSQTVQNATCGSSNGAIDLSVVGGWGNYSYSWSGGENTQDISNISSNSYTVTVSDNFGCSSTKIISVSDIGAPIVSTNNIINATCNGYSNGSVNLTATGTGMLTYTWSNGVNGQSNNSINLTVDTLSADDYTITVVDGNSCQTTTTITISEPLAITINSIVVNPLCFNQNNGEITVSASGGTVSGNYVYTWAHGSSLSHLINLADGVYTLTVKDDNNCTSTLNIELQEPDSITITADISPISCFGDDNGVISSIVNGGTQPYTYQWTGGSTQSFIDSLSHGTYILSILDNHNCAASTSFQLNQPYPLDVSLNPLDATCFGSDNGSINAIVNGGTQPYYYNWNNSDTTSLIENLESDIYWLTVTDDNGCTSVASSGIDEPDSMIVVINHTNILCHGDGDASIQTYVTGGTPNYTFAWNNGADTSHLSNLSGGIYYVTISDQNACSHSQSVIVYEPEELIIQPSVIEPTCFGDLDGQISLLVSGGTSPYDYHWNNGSSTDTLKLIGSGNFLVTVTDGNGCIQTENVIVNPSSEIVISTDYSPLICANSSTGFVHLNALGGNGTLTYQWSNSSSTNIQNNLSQGTYSCTVSDENLCFTTATYTIIEPYPLFVELQADYSYSTLTATVTGGIEPYNYHWSTGSSDSLLYSIQSGYYTLTVTDSLGCTIEATQTMISGLEIPNTITPNNDGKNDTWEIRGIGAYSDITIDIYNRWGDRLFSYSGNGSGYVDASNRWDGTYNGKDVPTGVYVYVLIIKELNENFNGTITVIR